MTDRSVIQEVRARTDLVELIGQYVPLRKTGSRYVARCPFHDEKSPSFNVSPDVGLYFCFGCKASGDALRFYEQMEGVAFPEALRALAEKAGVEVPETRDPEHIAEERRQRDVTERLYAVSEAAAEFFERSLDEAHFSELARGALEERGVSIETARLFRLGYAPASWDALAQHLRAKRFSPADAELAGLLMPGRGGNGFYDRFRHRLMFPVLDRAGKVVAFSGRVLPASEEIPEGVVPAETGKYINSPETPIYHKGELLYGLANARMTMRQKAEAVVVEGNFDVVQMHQHGFTGTVAPLGTSFTETQAKLLRRFAETVVLVFDGDDAGRKAARAAHSVCAKAGLMTRVGVMPPKMDPDSYLRSPDPRFGRDAMGQLLEKGPSLVEWLIDDAAAFAGDTIQGRAAALRSVVPLIAAIDREDERGMYTRVAANRFSMTEGEVRTSLKEHARRPTSAPDVRDSPDEIVRRLSLGQIVVNAEDTSAKAQRVATAAAVEAALAWPALLETADVSSVVDLVDGFPALLLREARAQWEQQQRLDGTQLLELAADDKQRHWLAARLMLEITDESVRQKCAETLAACAALLRKCRGLDYVRFLKFQSARAGVQGDSQGEHLILNEQLGIKRDIAKQGAAKRGGGS